LEDSRQLAEKILYQLSLDPRVRELGAKVLDRFRRFVGQLPASADHHHSGLGGLYQHSLEVAMKTLEEFEASIIMERRPDGSVDSFRSARNRPRWQYASFLSSLAHDLGKVFDMEVRAGEQRWCPLAESYDDFKRRCRMALKITWRPERQHGAHCLLSCLLLHHLLSAEDLEYLGLSRLVDVADNLASSHSRTHASPIARVTSQADQASVEGASHSSASLPDGKIGLFLHTLGELMSSGQLGVNMLGGQVYVMGEKTAIVVPLAVSSARDHLMVRKVVLPANTHLYNMLRNAKLVEPDDAGHCVRKIRVAGKQGSVLLNALIFPTEKVVPKQILPSLPASQFEIVDDPQLPTQEEEESIAGEQS